MLLLGHSIHGGCKCQTLRRGRTQLKETYWKPSRRRFWCTVSYEKRQSNPKSDCLLQISYCSTRKPYVTKELSQRKTIAASSTGCYGRDQLYREKMLGFITQPIAYPSLVSTRLNTPSSLRSLRHVSKHLQISRTTCWHDTETFSFKRERKGQHREAVLVIQRHHSSEALLRPACCQHLDHSCLHSYVGSRHQSRSIHHCSDFSVGIFYADDIVHEGDCSSCFSRNCSVSWLLFSPDLLS